LVRAPTETGRREDTQLFQFSLLELQVLT
jgi:hypothetical protein